MTIARIIAPPTPTQTPMIIAFRFEESCEGVY
jgi:hypothetical protein